MSKSNGLTGVKYRKLFPGIIINIVFGIAGTIIWIFGKDSVRMSGSSRDLATVFFAVVAVPVLAFYVVWYLKCLKKLSSAGGGLYKWVPFFALGMVASFVLTIVMALVLFQKAIAFAIITFALATIGSLISYLACKPE